jgi:hypothetical protein
MGAKILFEPFADDSRRFSARNRISNALCASARSAGNLRAK